MEGSYFHVSMWFVSLTMMNYKFIVCVFRVFFGSMACGSPTQNPCKNQENTKLKKRLAQQCALRGVQTGRSMTTTMPIWGPYR